MSYHPTEKCRQCKLNSCTVGSKWAALLSLHRTETPKDWRRRTSESMGREQRGSQGEEGHLGHPAGAQQGWAVRAPTAGQRLQDWVTPSEAKRSRVTLKDIKRLMCVCVAQREKALMYLEPCPRCKCQEGKKRWFIAVSLLSPSNPKRPHN